MPEQRNPWGERQPRVLAEGNAAAVKQTSARRTRRSFIVGGAAAAGGYGLWHWINNSPPIGRLQAVLRRSLLLNAGLDRKLFAERGLAPEFPLRLAADLRLNGIVGLEQQLVPESWRLQVTGVANAHASPRFFSDVTAWEYRYTGAMPPSAQALDVKDAPGNQPATPATPLAGAPTSASQPGRKPRQGNAEAGPSYSSLAAGTPGLLLTLSDLQQLPKVEFATEFKCVEGWSQITHWGGFRLRDFLEAYPPEQINGRDPRFLYMETPDGNFYGGYDLLAARHPQSLLVTEMSGRPLTEPHGAPLRLHMPIKYGYKQIKRIGLIAYTDTKPDDYWTKLGYDWYAGL